jgi:hypothetical protein
MVKKLEKGSTITTHQDQQEQDSRKGIGACHFTLPHQAQGSRNNLQEEKKINKKEIVLCMQREGSLGCGLHTS